MVPKFTTREVKLTETLGEKLKKVRESLKLTFDDVEKSTKIRKKYIKALESGDHNTLPPDVYVRGFLKSYAKILGLASQKVLALYEKEQGVLKNIKKVKKIDNTTNFKSPKIIITPRTLIIFIAILGVLGIVSYIGYQVTILGAPPKLTILSPKDNSTIKKNFIDITGKVDQGAEIFINGQKVNISEEGDFKVNVSIGQKGVNAIKILARNPKNGRTTEKTTNIIAEIPEVAVPQPAPEENAFQGIKVTLKIGPGTAWISIKKDGQKDFEGVMLPGTSKDFEAGESIILTTGNAGSTEVIFNGKSLGKLGRESEVKNSVVFDKNTKVE